MNEWTTQPSNELTTKKNQVTRSQSQLHNSQKGLSLTVTYEIQHASGKQRWDGRDGNETLPARPSVHCACLPHGALTLSSPLLFPWKSLWTSPCISSPKAKSQPFFHPANHNVLDSCSPGTQVSKEWTFNSIKIHCVYIIILIFTTVLLPSFCRRHRK